MIPVDSFVGELVQRLRFFRFFDPLPGNGRLLARYSGKQTFIKRLRLYLYDVTAAVGISAHIVPHQLRHTYATEMIRAGVSLPESPPRHRLDQLSNRLTKILSETRKLNAAG